MPTMSFNSIIQVYGQEEGMHMIRKYFVREINMERSAQGLPWLIEDTALSKIAQEQTDFVARNPKLYDRSHADTSRNPHYSYDQEGNRLLPLDRATKS
ncbi:MAG: hypothetical protein WCG98_02420 [bacterium]